MPTIGNKAHLTLDAACERIIAEFEKAVDVEPLEFTRQALGQVESRLQPALVTELARIELERDFDRDYLHSLTWKPSQFLEAFSHQFESTSLRSELAFEHYRLARLHGKTISHQDVGRLYDVEVEKWRELPLGNPLALKTGDLQYPRVGETFCTYPLIAELGRGALARVYLARQTDLASRLVVLKITSRLNAEAEKLARLQHTNIVPVYSVHRSTSQPQLFAICMPYLGSLTLADLLILFEGKSQKTNRIEELISTLVARRRSTLIGTTESKTDSETESSSTVAALSHHQAELYISTSDSAKDYVRSVPNRFDRQLGYDELMGALHDLIARPNDPKSACVLIEGIASGIAYAHSLGIVHRDLKPENILIANDGRPVILDFNLSGDASDSRPEIVGGTLPYMSLQQLKALDRQHRASPTDDVFAIGTIFYRLLTGALPYATRTLDQLTQLIEERKVAPAPVSKLATRVSPGLSAIVMKCLAADELQRYPSATELLEDLTRYRQYRPLRYAADRSLLEWVTRFVNRNPVVMSSSFISILAAVLVVACCIGWWWSSDRNQQLSQQLQLRHLLAAMPTVLADLHGPSRDDFQLHRGAATSLNLLEQWKVGSGGATLPTLARLLPEEQQLARDRLGQLAFALAGAEGSLSNLENDRPHSQEHLQSALKWNQIAGQLAPQLQAACRFQLLQLNDEVRRSADIQDDAQDTAADTALARVLLARQSRDWKGWLHWSDVMVSEQPDDATAWFNLGSANFTLGKYERAWSCFNVASKLQRASSAALFWRGVCSHQLGEFQSALVEFRECLKIAPNWIAAQQNCALAEYALHQLDDARKDASELIEKKQAGPRVWLLRAHIFALQGQAALAQQDRLAALKAPCSSADDWVALGIQYLNSNPEEALTKFRRAHEIDPTNLAALQNSAHVFSERLGQLDQAITMLDQLIELRPNEAGNYATRGILASRLGREDAALRDAAVAAGLHPKALEMHQIAGIYALCSQQAAGEAKGKHIAQSLAWLQKALADDPRLHELVNQDADLAAIKELPTYQELLASAQTLCKIN